MVVAVAMLAGCVAQGADGSAPGAPLRSFHDGDWRGTGRLAAPGTPGCGPDTITRTMRVRNGQAELDYHAEAGIRFSAAIAFGQAERARAPDADAPNRTTLTMRSGASIFRGEFNGDDFTGEYLGPACARRWTMRRVAAPGG